MWGWLGNNAVGLIQIVIALGALFLAFLAYKKVLKQIEISQKQEEKAGDQRDVELKIQLVDLSLTILEKVFITLTKQKEVLDLLEESLNSHSDKIDITDDSEISRQDIENLIASLKIKIEEMEGIKDKMLAVCDKLNSKNDFDYTIDTKYLSTMNSALIAIIHDSNHYELLKYNFTK